jgi:tetratricopeptide (TPR) repeat protein
MIRQHTREADDVIFISYRISDSNALVARLDDSLAAAFGRETVFRDRTRLQGGQQWTRELEARAQSCQIMLVVLGARWKTASFEDGAFEGYPRLHDPDDWVRREITAALEADRIVIPVFADGGRMPSQSWLANVGLAALYERQGVPIRTDEYDTDIARLIDLLRRHCPTLPAPVQQPASPPTVVASPLSAKRWSPAVPYALQPAPHFVGRDSLLTELCSWATSATPEARVVALVAAGGTGKTALAERVLSHMPQESEFGVFVWSFFENSHTEAFVRSACDYFLGESPVTVNENAPSTGALLDRLQVGWRECRSPHLLILDGLELVQSSGTPGRARGGLEDPVMKRLLCWVAGAKGTTVKALITSRFPLPDLEDWVDHGYRGIELQDLELSAARAVLRRRGVIGKDAELDRVADSVHCHALTVDVLGLYLSRFAAGNPKQAKGFNLKAFAAHQKAERLTTVLTNYAERLPNEERDLLARLSLFPRGVTLSYFRFIASTDARVSGALAGCSDASLVNLLEGMRDIGLVFVSEGSEGRTYSAHPFLRDFFRTLLGTTRPEDVHEAVRRHVAPSLAERPKKSPLTARELARYEELIELTRSSGDIRKAFRLYVHALGGFPHLGWTLGNFALGMRVLSGFSCSGSVSDAGSDLRPANRAVLLMQWSQFSSALGDLQAARAALDAFVALPTLQSNHGELSKGWWNIADIELLAGHWPKARDAAQIALHHAEESGDTLDLEYAHTYLASAYGCLGALDSAEKHFTDAMRIAESVLYAHRGVREAEFRLLTGDVSQARRHTAFNLRTCRKHQWTHNEARCYTLLGRCVLPDVAAARTYLEAAREYVERTGNIDVSLRSYLLATEIARQDGQLPRSTSQALDGIQLADSVGFGRWSLDARLELAKTHVAAGEFAAVIDPASWVLRRASEPDCEYKWGAADAAHLLGVAHARLANRDLAEQYLRRALEGRQSLGHPALHATEDELSQLTSVLHATGE